MSKDSHQQEIDELEARQLILIRQMSPEDAMAVLTAAPISNHHQEQDVIANIQQRHVLMSSIERRKR